MWVGSFTLGRNFLNMDFVQISSFPDGGVGEALDPANQMVPHCIEFTRSTGNNTFGFGAWYENRRAKKGL